MSLKKNLLYVGVGILGTLGTWEVKDLVESKSEFVFSYRKINERGYVLEMNGGRVGGCTGACDLSLRDMIQDSLYPHLTRDSTFFDYLEREMNEKSGISLDDKIKELKIVVKK